MAIFSGLPQNDQRPFPCLPRVFLPVARGQPPAGRARSPPGFLFGHQANGIPDGPGYGRDPAGRPDNWGDLAVVLELRASAMCLDKAESTALSLCELPGAAAPGPFPPRNSAAFRRRIRGGACRLNLPANEDPALGHRPYLAAGQKHRVGLELTHQHQGGDNQGDDRLHRQFTSASSAAASPPGDTVRPGFFRSFQKTLAKASGFARITSNLRRREEQRLSQQDAALKSLALLQARKATLMHRRDQLVAQIAEAKAKHRATSSLASELQQVTTEILSIG